MAAILFGLSSAIVWGSADFCGGLASRKSRAYQAVLLGEAVGLVLLLVGTLFVREAPLTLGNWLLCSLAGGLGVLGLLLLFHSLATGHMTVAAPVSALTATILPVIIGSFMEGFPGVFTYLGFALALAAIWFISQPDGGPRTLSLRLKDLTIPLIAGVSFGIYFVLIDQGSRDQVILPMVASRASGTLTMLLYALIARRKIAPAVKALPYILLNGVLDISGNGLYILAAQVGRMDVSAVLSSLYPAPTVLLAWLLLRERISRLQSIGILAALGAIVLMTL
jgi:drug/metabolite transporter (DMT)-like permease